MPGIVDWRKDLIGQHSWWQQKDNKVFVVIGFVGWDLAEAVEALEYGATLPIEIPIDDFISKIERKSIKRISQ